MQKSNQIHKSLFSDLLHFLRNSQNVSCEKAISLYRTLQRDQICSIWWKRSVWIQKLFGLHSFRSGGATAAANNGVKYRLFKRHGRWKSEKARWWLRERQSFRTSVCYFKPWFIKAFIFVCLRYFHKISCMVRTQIPSVTSTHSVQPTYIMKYKELWRNKWSYFCLRFIELKNKCIYFEYNELLNNNVS